MVQWTLEKDQLLFKSTLNYHKIILSQEFLQHLADQIGEGCSKKAVSMHLQKYFSNVSKKSTGSTKSTPAKATPRKQISTPKATPRSRVKLTSTSKSFLRKKMANSDSDPGDDDDDDEEASPSPLANRKRARSSEKVKSYMESDADSGESEDYSPKKRVKQEPVDDDADCVLDSVFGRHDKYDAFA